MIERELAEIREKSNTLKANWKKEKDLIARTRALKEKIERLRVEEQTEERKGNLQRVAEIRYGLIRQSEEELARLTKQMESQGAQRMLKEEVDEEDVAKIVSKWTGIPVSKMLEGEVKKLVTMEDRLRHRVVGQDEAFAVQREIHAAAVVYAHVVPLQHQVGARPVGDVDAGAALDLAGPVHPGLDVGEPVPADGGDGGHALNLP